MLVRALEPRHGIETMRERRGPLPERALCSGPGKLCEALAVDRSHDHLPLDAPPFALLKAEETHEVLTGPRIGITKGAETPWRFGARGSPFLSRPMKVVPSP